MNTGTQWKSGEWTDVPSALPTAPQPVNTNISVVLPFIEKEIGDVETLLNRSLTISEQIPRNLFLVPFKGLRIDDIQKLAEKAFTSVAVIHDSEGVLSDWQGRSKMRSAAGPNSLFRQVAWFFYLNRRYGSWLWLEPDCWLVSPRWIYELEREHFEVGRAFSGVKMRIGSEKEYMNGVGIYPWNAVQYAPLLVQSATWQQHPEFEVGFDVAGGDDVLKHAHMTKLIQLTNHLAGGNVTIRPETVLCHGRIDLSAVPVLAEPKDNGQLVIARESTNALSKGSAPSTGISNDLESLDSRGGAQNIPEGSDEPCARPLMTASTDNETSNAAPTVQPAGAASHPVQEFAPISPDIERAIEEHEHRAASQPVESHDSSAQDSKDYGAVSKAIRLCVDDLCKLWDDQPHRKVLIVKELRKAKLVPKHFR